jgi:nitroimidazol reductase NimA-like FMN-containing flavoprotein (pyridoxamine 5'-phosphate oxidase superfamily)
MPGYGLPADTSGLKPWSWGEQILRDAHNYWLATASAHGRPHVMPVWAVWAREALWLSTGGQSRKARNLAERSDCSAGAEIAGEAVIVEGAAVKLAASDAPAEIAQLYTAKYGHGYPEDSPLFRVEPRVAFGFSEAADEFGEAATRWRFEREV